jgi:uncharacterized ferritin-like protein (DUF455 family)
MNRSQLYETKTSKPTSEKIKLFPPQQITRKMLTVETGAGQLTAETAGVIRGLKGSK